MKHRIAYCIPGLYNPGGMERILSVKANYLAEQGYEIHIITTEQMGRPIFFPLHPSIKTYHLDLDYEGSNGGPLYRKLWAYLTNQPRHKRALRRILREIAPDVTISMFGHDADFLPDLQEGGRKVLEYHFSKLKRLQYGRKGLWRLLDEWRTKQDERIVRRFDAFVVLTEEDKALWGNTGNIHVIPNPKPFESEHVSPLKDKTIIAAGRYCHQKNFEALISIWSSLASQYPEWSLAIYGDGEDRPKLEKLRTDLGLEKQLHLRKPTNDMRSVYLESSIYAMTSRYEGLPMVLIEAQTMGLPIVSYACKCGPRDIITPEVDGYLLEEGDEAGFSQALRQLIEDEELRHRMGQAARKHSSRYDLPLLMQQWIKLLD